MDFRAAFVFLSVLVAQAPCGVIREDTMKQALEKTIQMLRDQEVRTVLDLLDKRGRFDHDPCPHLNTTELGAPEERVLTGYHLSSFGCYILKVSHRPIINQTENLPQNLKNISHYLDSIKTLMNDSPDRQDCSLPHLDHRDVYVYVKCLLQRLDLRLSNALI